MIRLTRNQLLLLILFIEGYAVLAAELLAIRLLVPFVGSGTEVVSIVISAVLLPLAAGYYQGGKAYNRHRRRAARKGRKALSVRALLARNFTVALLFLAPGLSYGFMTHFFGWMEVYGITHRLPQTAIYTAIFLVYPVFLLGQTVPLISNYFSRRKLSEATGRILFFSTTGSFLGSVFSTLVLMMTVGVHVTAIITLTLLALLIPLLARRRQFLTAIALVVIAWLWLANNQAAMDRLGIVSNNAYNTIAVDAHGDIKIFSVNRSPSSLLGKDGKTFSYVEYLDSLVLTPSPDWQPRDILVIGAGGFTFGLHDSHNRYTYVDIDPAIKDAAESHFLGQTLAKNKMFLPESARAFVHKNDARYDFILIDVYTNKYATPMEATTREFLIDAKKLLKKDGVLVLHTGTSPTFEDAFTVRYHNTFASVFPVFTRQVIGGYALWPDGRKGPAMNVILYMYFNRDVTNDRGIYTDDKNTYSLDR